MANGRVITGYSDPFVAIYTATDTGTPTVTYSSGQALARGVSISISPDSGSDNKFYADNVEAESAGTIFNGGTASIEVDGLKPAARTLIYGLAAAEDGWTKFGDGQEVPFVGFGCVVRYMENGVTTYEPLILPKVQFAPEPTEAATQEEDIDWQTTTLEASISRDAFGAWKMVGTAQTTQALAVAAIKAKFNID